MKKCWMRLLLVYLCCAGCFALWLTWLIFFFFPFLTSLLQLDYFETILNPYFTHDARESLKNLQGVLLEKATVSVAEAVENPGHHRRPTRGSEDALADERQQGMTVSPDDLIVRIFISMCCLPSWFVGFVFHMWYESYSIMFHFLESLWSQSFDIEW